ncbi:MAG: hypothetical protein ACF8R7_07165 [Phycisphaerales bacterium JB039]
MLWLRYLACVVVIGCGAGARAQQMYMTGFPGEALPPEMLGFSTPGYGVEVGAGVCSLSKDQGVTTGTASVRLCRWVDGDFAAQVTADRSAGAQTGSTGLIVWYPGASYSNIFFFEGGTIAGNIFQSGAGSRTIGSAAAMANFRIRRTGQDMTLEFDDGSGWTTLHSSSSPALLGPVRAGFFSVEERSMAPGATFAFDDFAVEADVLAECYADCDCSVSLDLFDFLCFQNSFAAGDRYADCDGTGVLDFIDFLCVQNGFAAGCL